MAISMLEVKSCTTTCDRRRWRIPRTTHQRVTGDEPMTGPQRSYLHTLAQEAACEIPDDMTKAQASELIDELRQQTGRGAD